MQTHLKAINALNLNFLERDFGLCQLGFQFGDAGLKYDVGTFQFRGAILATLA